MSSFSSGSSYDSLLSSASSSKQYGSRLPRPLSTVIEESRNSQATLWNDEEKKDTETALQASPTRKDRSQSQPNLSTKRVCRLLITFGFIGIIAFCWGGLHLEKSTSRKSNASPWVPRFDYIVVGGGPSGIITAVKLARRFPRLSVLLLEAGTQSQSQVLSQHYSRNKDTCTAANNIPPNSQPNWNKFDVPLLWSGVASSQPRSVPRETPTVSDPHLWQLPGVMMVGRGLGGSGILNAMIYVRSIASDWERWNLTENWDFNRDVVPHFVALESYRGNGSPEDGLWRGSRGPITTIAANGTDAVGQAFVRAALEAGWPASKGFNTNNVTDRLGAGFYEFNVRFGTRDSVAQALLGRRQIPPNLSIKTGQRVTSLLISPTGDVRAEGIAYQTTSGQIGEYLLTEDDASEVILAAGAILTPQLLQHSGLGPNGTILDIPGVGANLQDHPVVALAYEIVPTSKFHQIASIYTIGNDWEDYMLAATDLANVNATDPLTPSQKYSSERLGTLGTPGFSAGAFLRSPWARSEDNAPDIQITVFPRVMEPHVMRSRRDQYSEKFMESSAMLVTVALLQADARYTVKASSFNATANNTQVRKWSNFKAPTIELPVGRSSYLSPRDIRRLEWGVNEVRKVMRTSPLNEELGVELIPGQSIEESELRQWINTSVLPNAHWVGTTKMGTQDDPLAVVNETLLVKGTTNIRVVDAGVIPNAPNGNIHTTVVAVAARGSELIAQARYQNSE